MSWNPTQVGKHLNYTSNHLKSAMQEIFKALYNRAITICNKQEV